MLSVRPEVAATLWPLHSAAALMQLQPEAAQMALPSGLLSGLPSAPLSGLRSAPISAPQ